MGSSFARQRDRTALQKSGEFLKTRIPVSIIVFVRPELRDLGVETSESV